MIKSILAGWFRHGLTSAGGYLIAHGLANSTDVATLSGAGLVVAGIALSWFQKLTAPTAPPAGSVGLVIALLLGAFCFTGCTSMVNTPQGKILSVSERGIGFHVTYKAQTETPDVVFGFWSSATILIPTSTNGPTLAAPNFANKFGFHQASALSLGINEDIVSGNYATYDAGSTNSAILAQPITPK